MKSYCDMTISEEKQLSNYIKGLVREALGEMDSMPSWWNDKYGYDDEEEDGFVSDEAPDVSDEPDDDKPAGLDELRQLAEGYARSAVKGILMEKKKKKGKRKKKKEKTSSKDKTIVSQLNADGTNAAHYYYKLYGVENGTEAQKAAARSKGYKKAKGKKNDTGVPYKFTSKERNRLNSLLTDRK